MSSRVLRTAVILILALSAVSCSGAPAPAAAPSPVWTASPEASPVRPPATVSGNSSTSVPPTPSPAPSATNEPPGTVSVFSQPARSSGGLLLSSLNARDETATKYWVWESFAFDKVQPLTEIRWRGAYDPAARGRGGPVREFTIEIYPSIPNGAEPDVANRPLVHFDVDGNAGETPAGKVAGVDTFDYSYTLPLPFEAAPYTPYWIQIEALQTGGPDWGLVQASGGDAQHYRRRVVSGATNAFALVPGDPSIELLASTEPEDAANVVTWDREITPRPLPPAEVITAGADGVQEVVLVISRSGYTPMHFAVKKGAPVRIVFRQLGYVPGGNILLVRWGAQKEKYLTLDSLTDTKVLEFTPDETGDFRFNCPHYWYEGVMTVQP